MLVIVPPTPALATLNELLSILIIWYCSDPCNGNMVPIPVSWVYTTLSPPLNPWLSKLIVLVTLLTPIGLTANFLLVYPDPPSITLIFLNVLVYSDFLNLWIPCPPVILLKSKEISEDDEKKWKNYSENY